MVEMSRVTLDVYGLKDPLKASPETSLCTFVVTRFAGLGFVASTLACFFLRAFRGRFGFVEALNRHHR
jgi:hypothetical protein